MAGTNLQGIVVSQDSTDLGGVTSFEFGSRYDVTVSGGVAEVSEPAISTQYVAANGDYQGWSGWNGGSVSWTGSRMRVTSSGSLSGMRLSRTTGPAFEKGKSYVILFEDVSATTSTFFIQDYWGTVESKTTSFRMNLPSGSDTTRGWGVFQFDCKTDTGQVVIYSRTGGQTWDFASYRVYEVAPNNQGNLFVSLGRDSYSSFQGVAIGDTANASQNGVSIGADSDTIADDTYDTGGSSGPAVAVGFGAKSLLWRSIAMGEYAMAAAVSSTAIGANAYASLRHGVALGRGAICPSTDGWIDMSAHPTPPKFSMGGSIGAGEDSNVYIANGWGAVSDVSPNGIAVLDNTSPGSSETRIHGQCGWDAKATPTLTDQPGGAIYICGGQSTGTADGGVAGFQVTAASGSSSNDINSLVTAIQADPGATGDTYLKAYSKAAAGLVEVTDIVFEDPSTFYQTGAEVVTAIDAELGSTDWQSGGGGGVEGGGGGTVANYSVAVADSPYTMPEWEAVYEIQNDTGDITLILPASTAGTVGNEVNLWIENNTANNKVFLLSSDTSHEVNHVAADGSDVARAEFNSERLNFSRVTAQSMGLNKVYVDNADEVYNARRFVANFSSTVSYAPFNYLELSSVPTDFLTDNNDWWFAVKVETPMASSGGGQVLFGSNNANIGYRGDGAGFGTHGTNGYQMPTSPSTPIQPGEWIIFRNNVSANLYTAWVNGVKVLNATPRGVTMPSAAPTSVWFGSAEGSASKPVGYNFPLSQCKISNISLGSGLISDSDAALFTAETYSCPTLTGGTLTNQWRFGSLNSAITETGAIDLTLVGPDLSTEEL